MNERQYKNTKTVFHHSLITSRNYRIDIAHIGDTSLENPHVLYVLDGKKSVPLLSILAQNFINPSNPQNLIIVGIDYNDINARGEDYLPHDDNDRGARLFYQCILQEIHPLIVEQCNLTNYTKSIFGHSFGAVFACYVLCHHGDDFSHYFISSPSLWVDENWMAKCEQQVKSTPHSIHISCAEYEQYPNPTIQESPERLAVKAQRKMCCDSFALRELLSKKLPNIYIRYNNYSDATHQNVLPLSAYDALKYLLA